MSGKFDKFVDLEKDFFELDDEKKLAYFKLHFEKPSDIFDFESITKTPLLNDDFIDWFLVSFDYIPKKYKIDLEVSFDDLQGYSQEELENIFKKNVLLEFKKTERKAISKNKVAYSLIGIGLVFLVSMILITTLWHSESVLKTIFSYVFDIATTVTIWEAMNILLVESKERRSVIMNLEKRFYSIKFNGKN